MLGNYLRLARFADLLEIQLLRGVHAVLVVERLDAQLPRGDVKLIDRFHRRVRVNEQVERLSLVDEFLAHRCLVDDRHLVDLRIREEHLFLFGREEIEMLHGTVVVTDVVPRRIVVLALFLEQFGEEGVLDRRFDLLDVLHVAVRPHGLDTLRYLAQNKRRARRGRNGHERRVAASVALEHLGLTELRSQIFGRLVRALSDQFENFVVQFRGVLALEREHLRLQVRMPTENSESERTVPLGKRVRTSHEEERLSVIFALRIAVRLKLLDEFAHDGIQECDERFHGICVLPCIVVQDVDGREHAHERFVDGAGEHDLRAEVARPNLHPFVLVHVDGLAIDVIGEENVRITDFVPRLNDFGPQRALLLVSGDHLVHPLVAHGHAMGELLNGVSFGADVEELVGIGMLERQIRRKLSATSGTLAHDVRHLVEELHEVNRSRRRTVVRDGRTALTERTEVARRSSAHFRHHADFGLGIQNFTHVIGDERTETADGESALHAEVRPHGRRERKEAALHVAVKLIGKALGTVDLFRTIRDFANALLGRHAAHEVARLQEFP